MKDDDSVLQEPEEVSSQQLRNDYEVFRPAEVEDIEEEKVPSFVDVFTLESFYMVYWFLLTVLNEDE